MHRVIYILSFIVCHLSLFAQSGSVYQISSHFADINTEQERYNDLYDYLQILVDPTGNWTYTDVLKKKDQFTTNHTRTASNLDSVYWARLEFHASEAGKYLFSAGYPFDDYALVDIYYENGDSIVHQVGGAQRLAVEKTIRRSGSYFWVEVPKDTVLTVYLRLDNVAWKSDFWRRNPVSIYHIDPTSAPDLTGAYVLPDFPEDRVAVNSWEPNQISKFPGAYTVPSYWLTEPPKIISLGRYFEFFPDQECTFTLEELQAKWDDQAFLRGYKWFEFDFGSCYWAHLVVINPKPFAQSRTFAYFNYPWDEITYFLPDPTGRYEQFTAFPNEHQMEAFSFTIQALDTMSIYIRYPPRSYGYRSNGSMVDVEPEGLNQQQNLVGYKYFLCGGVIFFLVYCLLQLIVSRDKLLLNYFLSVLGTFIFLLMVLDDSQLFGFTQIFYLHLPNPGRSLLTAVAGTISAIGSLNFTGIAFQLNSTFPNLDRIRNYGVWIVLILGLIISVFEIWFWETESFYADKMHQFLHFFIYNFYALIAAFILFTSIKAVFRGVPLSRSFLIALLPFCLGVVVSNFGLFAFVSPFVRQFLFIAGMLLSTMLFGVLVAGRSNLLKLEKARAIQQKTQLENQLLLIESKALRAQMNPHFIFNCLNSIKSLIQEAANKQAVHYLNLFSKFIRKILQNSEEKQITLEEELEMSRLYIEMEKLRFEKSFTYKVEIDPGVDTSFFKVPPMILQPFLENAIWHGLMHKEGEREIKLEIKAKGEGVKCIVEDNGIGRQQAAALNLNRQHRHRSFGTRLILDRLQVNKDLFNSHFMVDIIDKMVNDQSAGTRVELVLEG